MTTNEVGNIDQLVNQKPCFVTQLFLHHNRSVQNMHHCWSSIDQPVILPLPPTITRKQDSDTQRGLFTPFQLRLMVSDLEVLILMLFHLLQADSVRTKVHVLLSQKDSHCLQTVAMWHWSQQARQCLSPGCALNLDPWRLRTELVTKGSPNGVQPSLEISLTEFWQCKPDSWSICTETGRPKVRSHIPFTYKTSFKEYHEQHSQMPLRSLQSTCGLAGQISINSQRS